MSRAFLYLLSSLLLLFSLQPVYADDLPRRPYFGCQLQMVPDSLREQVQPPFEGGILVGDVKPNSSALVAGIQSGDILTSISGTKISSPQEFTSTLNKHRSATKVEIQLLRGNKQMTKRVKLKPFPKETSSEYDVLYESVKVDNALRRIIITRPKPKGVYPVIFFVGGIGCYSLDLPPGTPHPYNTILAELARSGFITVRVEKSGMGDSQGSPCSEVNFTTELKGYVAAIRALGTYNFMDTTNIILLGHSMGGIIAPLVYREYPVKGIIAIATAATSWFEYELINQRRQLVLEGMDYDTIEIKSKKKELILHKLLVDNQTPEQILQWDSTVAEDLQYPCHYTYIQEVAALNMAHEWKIVDAPTLVIYGLADFVTSAEDHRYLTDLINRYHSDRATYVEVKDMDHFFIKTATQQSSFENLAQGRPNRAFSDDVLPVILNWSKALVIK
jgi:pimeloyl-ACP methyl ester carboxylesterase